MADEKSMERISDNMIGLIRVFRIMGHGEAKARLLPLSPRYWVLGYLMKEDLSMSELGARLHRSKPNMTAIIDGLIKEGLIRRKREDGDRRVVIISITPKGRRDIEKKKRSVAANIKRNLSTLSNEDIAGLSRALEDIGRIISKIT